MNGMATHNLSNGWVNYQNRTCPNTVDFNSAIGGIKKDTEITGHNCGFESLKTLTPDLAYHSAGGVKAEYHCSYLSIESQICNSSGNKKGSTANATSLNCIFLKYQLNQSIHYSVSRCWRKVQLPDCLALRCLRLISAFAAVTRKPAVLSPSSFSISISFITSCGIRTVVICDFAFFAPVAITDTPYVWCISVYAKKTILKALKCISLDASFKSKSEIHLEKQNPDNAENTGGVSNHNVNWSNTMAMYKSTQTHPKFKWRFFSCQQSRYLTVEARSEQEARSMLPDAPCLFSARIRQGVNHA
ncbi:TPA: host cell division inhibitor Icd-like protein [Morganella morganii]